MPSETSCPACHDELFTAEYGCKKCGHGRASFFARHALEFGIATFFVVCSVGVGVLFTFGRYIDVPGLGPILNLAFIAVGAVLAAVGVWFLGRPSGIASRRRTPTRGATCA